MLAQLGCLSTAGRDEGCSLCSGEQPARVSSSTIEEYTGEGFKWTSSRFAMFNGPFRRDVLKKNLRRTREKSRGSVRQSVDAGNHHLRRFCSQRGHISARGNTLKRRITTVCQHAPRRINRERGDFRERRLDRRSRRF